MHIDQGVSIHLLKKSILNGDNLQKLVLGGSGKEIIVVVQLLSRVRLFATPWTASLSFLQSLSKLMSIESGMLSNHLILCHPWIMLFMYKARGAHKQIHSISGVLKFNEKCDQEKKCLIWLLEIEKKNVWENIKTEEKEFLSPRCSSWPLCSKTRVCSKS